MSCSFLVAKSILKTIVCIVQIKFVEVKTDTDKPSMKQLQWMQYLAENGIDTGFCYVGVHTTRCKARSEPAVQKSLRDAIMFENSPP